MEYDYVFNLASETKYDQPQMIYDEKITEVAKAVIAEAKKHKGLKRIFDISTAHVYAHGSKHVNESGKIKPWTGIAEAKLTVEKLWMDSGLPVVLLRPAIVYGPGDQSGLMPRITIARVYRYTGSRMKFLWGGDLKLNTVHVDDVCRALWHLTTKGETSKIYNLADKNDTDQKKLNELLEAVFAIKTGFVNAVMCKFAKINLKAATETVNSRHLRPWSTLCSEHKIEASPISPFLAPELLSDHSLSVDGSAIEATGFTYSQPKVTTDLIQAELDYWVQQGVFPALKEDEAKGDGEGDDEFDDEDIEVEEE